MAAKIKEFNEFPQNIKISLILQIISWATLFVTVSYYLYIHGQRLNVYQITSGAAVWLSILTIKNWARWLCIACNLMLIIQFIRVVPRAIEMNNIAIWVIFGLNVALLSSATLFLMLKPTSDFFKANSTPLYGSAPSEQNGNQE